MKNQLKFQFLKDYEKENHKKCRELTIRLTITDPSKAKWLWLNKDNPELGVFITGLADGDLYAKMDLMEEALGDLESELEWDDKFPINPITAVFDKIDNL